MTQSALSENNQALVLKSGMLIDGTGALPIDDAVVVISNDRIAKIGPKTKIQIPAKSKVIDVEGGTILPGFINAHERNTLDA
jgi:imidazolonepropionase-like amidohydrolase